MSAGDLTPETWSPAPVDPESEGWIGTKHDPRFPMIHSAQAAIDAQDGMMRRAAEEDRQDG